MHEEEARYRAALRGDFAGLDPRAAPPPYDREGQAWFVARLAAAHAAGLPVPRLTTRDLEPWLSADTSARRAAGRFATELLLEAWRTFDAASLSELVAAHRALTGDLEDAESRLWTEATTLAARVLGADWRDTAAACRDLERRAATESLPDLVLLAAALQTVALLRDEDVEMATAVARRMSRMARAEGMPQFDYLAAILLARVRRLGGRPHLAVRILRALLGFAPLPWHPWIAWELLWAGDRFTAARALNGLGGTTPSPASLAATAFHAALSAYAAGNPGAAATSLSAIAGRRISWPLDGADAALVRVAIDPTADVRDAGSKRLERWATGATATPPAQLLGLATREDGAPGDAVAVIALAPGHAARRLLRAALPSLREAGFAPLALGDRAQERTERLLSALACAGPGGLTAELLHGAVYGTPFEGEASTRTLNVLVHRAREGLPEGVSLDRLPSGTLALATTRPCFVLDPWCVESAHDRMLRLVAASPGLGASDAASSLGISLRSAQEVLKELAEDGLCVRERDAGRSLYDVVDTTFSPPTRH